MSTPGERAAEEVRAIEEALSHHTVKPDGTCACGLKVNSGNEKGLERAASLNRHRAMVLYGLGYRRPVD